MNIFSLMKLISSHPLNEKHKLKAISRFFRWQLSIKLSPYPIIYPFTEKAKLIIEKGMTGATGNLYYGLHEYNDMAFLIHFLREDDLFVDIGANIGSYTVLASSHVGADTLSFEPVPSTFSNLENNISINQIKDKVTTYNIALGSEPGSIDFTTSLDTVNHVAEKNDTNTISVSIETLDFIMQSQKIPVLMKIDVEGFETEVIKGALETLGKAGLKAIIIELNGSGERYGYDEKEIHNTLVDLDFRPYKYDPRERTLTDINLSANDNTIYIRDRNFVTERVKSASKVKILDTEI